MHTKAITSIAGLGCIFILAVLQYFYDHNSWFWATRSSSAKLCLLGTPSVLQAASALAKHPYEMQQYQASNRRMFARSDASAEARRQLQSYTNTSQLGALAQQIASCSVEAIRSILNNT